MNETRKPERRKLTDREAGELLGDVFSLAAKLLHDRDAGGVVEMADLVELRDKLNEIRGAVAGGSGYKAFGGRIAKSERGS